MDNSLPLIPAPVWILAGVVAVVLGALGLYRFIRFRSSRAYRVAETIRAVSHDSLRNIVLPDGVDGQIEIETLLLTARGLVVLDIKDVEGAIFAGDNMDDWTVLSGKTRHTLRNPLRPLNDRVLAVRALVSDVPVTGYVVFTDTANFPRGRPDAVVPMADLKARLGDGLGPQDRTVVDAFYRPWDQLRRLAAPA